MNKKIYSTPLIEQTECLGISNLCGGVSPMGNPEEQSGEQAPGNFAPQRPMF